MTQPIKIRRVLREEEKAVENLTLAHLSDEGRKKYQRINPGHARLVREVIQGEKGICLVAEVENQIVGYLIGVMKESSLTAVKYAELLHVSVQPAYRRRGIGKGLVKKFIAWGSRQGAHRVTVAVGPNNQAAIKFYQALQLAPATLWLERDIR